SLELLEASGVTERLLAEGLRIKRFRIVGAHRALVKIKFKQLESRFNFLLGLPQSRTEAILEQALAERGVAVERGIEALGVAAGPEGNRVLLRRNGEDSTVAADHVLAADGAHSTLRKALSIGFPGTRAPQTFHMIDAKLAWGFPHDEVFALMRGRRPLACIPLPEEGCYRLIGIEEKPAERLPPSSKIERLDWESSFQVSYRLAERFTQGAVYLAGDAAHIHSPIGARGMNLGIEDACVFASLAARGELARYAPGRRSVARGVLRLTENFTRLIATQRPLVRWLRDNFGFPLLHVHALRRRAMRGVAGLDHPNPVRD
ncbi:MAG TPA: FAD-dependent monooxygenase, partial [Kiloniellales bacterium]|nr:FAD-dependent monooxygenase [Kiloniellales bacterium]